MTNYIAEGLSRRTIREYARYNTIKTTVGIIHYSKTGAHIVPAAPIE